MTEAAERLSELNRKKIACLETMQRVASLQEQFTVSTTAHLKPLLENICSLHMYTSWRHRNSAMTSTYVPSVWSTSTRKSWFRVATTSWVLFQHPLRWVLAPCITSTTALKYSVTLSHWSGWTNCSSAWWSSKIFCRSSLLLSLVFCRSASSHWGTTGIGIWLSINASKFTPLTPPTTTRFALLK